MHIKYTGLILSAITLISCRTVDLETKYYKANPPEEEQAAAPTAEPFFISPPQIIYVDTATTPDSQTDQENRNLSGSDAVKQYQADNLVLPEYTENHLKSWIFKKDKVYEIHTQTFHSTMIKLEPGEEMLEVPYVSEADVWRISRGVGQENGLPTQFLFIKPDYSGLESTLDIVTNKRVYLTVIKSYKDHYMPLVKWIYGDESSFMNMDSYVKWQQQKAAEEKAAASKKKEYPSPDYKMYYTGKAPVWLPEYVWDDGAKTYFVLNERCLHTELPALFNAKNELINYRVDSVSKNTLVADQLIEKATLKLGKKKVTIEKKITRKPPEENSAEPVPDAADKGKKTGEENK
jgi:type IV secretion system protein TrbG